MIMKRILASLVLVMLTLLASCEKETLLTVDQTSLSFTDAGGSNTVSLTANKPWTASSNQSWCKVSPSGGEEAASSRITISCDANTTYDARNATVTFTCAEMTKTVSVSQATNNGLFVSQTSYELTKAAQQLIIQVQANVKFSVEVDNRCKDWVKYNSTKGLTTNTVVLDISENKSYDSREGKITIKQDGGSLSSTVTIKQSQLDGLFLTTSEYNLSNEKHTLTVEVSTNVEFDVNPEADWVKYVQTKGLSTKQIILDVLENDTYDQRETKVNVKQKNGDLSGVITIKQDEKYGILVSQPEYNLSNEATMIDVEVKYNVDFEVVIPDDSKDWIKQVSTKSLSSKTYSFSVAKNETYDNREGSITFKQKKGAISTTVAVKQAQTDYLEVAKKEYTVDIEGETITIDVTSNVAYTVTISDDAKSWLSRVDTKGLSQDKVQIAVASGNDNTDRKGEIAIAYGEMKHTITVHQYSYAANTIIQFADEKVKAKLVEAFDTNKDGELSIKEAREVKSIEGVFGAIKTYSSFDEFQYFTGVTKLPAFFFEDWTLNHVILPESLEEIGAGAFYACHSLTEISIPERVVILPSIFRDNHYCGVFTECTKLNKVELPNSLRVIGERTFADCSSLDDIIFPEGLVELNYRAFENCTSLKTINIPGSVNVLGTALFAYCKNLRSVTLQEGVSSISSGNKYNPGCFQGCTNLESIKLPSSLIGIGAKVFAECVKLRSIDIPAGVKGIGHQAFYRCSSLTYFSIPDGVTTIEGGTFSGCENLEVVVIPPSITEIKSKFSPLGETESMGAFSNCGKLKAVSIPDKVPAINDGTFAGCRSLTSVVIPESVSLIGDRAFQNCSGLVSISIPESVSRIGEGAFMGCSGLLDVTIPESLSTISSQLFSGCSKLTKVNIPNSVHSIGTKAFAECVKLNDITLSEEIESIPSGCFYGCSGLTSIAIPDRVSRIGSSAFEGCGLLTKCNIPSGVIEIESSAFKDCKSLETIDIPNGIKIIQSCTFLGCSKLKKIVIPNGVTAIYGASWGYYGRTSGGAFEGCSSLSEVTIPNSVTILGDSSFDGCNSLSSVKILPVTPPTLNGWRTFEDTNNCPLYVPEESIAVYKTSEYWQAYAARIQSLP